MQISLLPEITKALELLSLPAGNREVENLTTYLSLIQMGTNRHRLVGDESYYKIIYKHLFDSLYPLTVMKMEQGPLLDVGTGAGLPGIPLKIFLPEIPIYFLDSSHRKISFVKHVCRCLKLEGVFFLLGRAEKIAGDIQYRETFQYVCSRAVARTNLLAEIALPFTVLGGQVVLYKGPAAEKEIIQAKTVLELCGGRISKRVSYKLPTGEQRVIIIIDKVFPTPSRYPRRIFNRSKG